MTKKKFYITSAIPPVNAKLHMGHALEMVGADVVARAKRMLGCNVMFQAGTDEHGQRLANVAYQAELSPKTYADKAVRQFLMAWDALNISYDNFVRTTDAQHKLGVEKFWREANASGSIYLDKRQGWHCVLDESFFTQSQVKEGLDEQKLCPKCGHPLAWCDENSYFFNLSNFEQAIDKWIKDHPGFITPIRYQDEITNSFLKVGLENVSISCEILKWGISVPEDPEHVIYMWFDALISYITGIGYGSDEEEFQRWWPADLQIIDEDTLRSHALLWPGMLLAAGIEFPKRIFVHGRVLTDENHIDPLAYIAACQGNADPLRYYLLREIGFGQDGVFNQNNFFQRYQSDLTDGLGSLVSRVTSMVCRYRNGMLPGPDQYLNVDHEVIQASTELFQPDDKSEISVFESLIDSLEFHVLLARSWEVINKLNWYVNETKPWDLVKTDPKRLDTILYVLCEGLRLAALQLISFLPSAGSSILYSIGYKDRYDRFDFAQDTRWGGLIEGGTVLQSMNLFPKLS